MIKKLINKGATKYSIALFMITTTSYGNIVTDFLEEFAAREKLKINVKNSCKFAINFAPTLSDKEMNFNPLKINAGMTGSTKVRIGNYNYSRKFNIYSEKPGISSYASYWTKDPHLSSDSEFLLDSPEIIKGKSPVGVRPAGNFTYDKSAFSIDVKSNVNHSIREFGKHDGDPGVYIVYDEYSTTLDLDISCVPYNSRLHEYLTVDINNQSGYDLYAENQINRKNVKIHQGEIKRINIKETSTNHYDVNLQGPDKLKKFTAQISYNNINNPTCEVLNGDSYIKSCTAEYLSTVPYVLRVILKSDSDLEKSNFHVLNHSGHDVKVHDGHDFPYTLTRNRSSDRKTYIEADKIQPIHIEVSENGSIKQNEGYIAYTSFPTTSSRITSDDTCTIKNPDKNLDGCIAYTAAYKNNEKSLTLLQKGGTVVNGHFYNYTKSKFTLPGYAGYVFNTTVKSKSKNTIVKSIRNSYGGNSIVLSTSKRDYTINYNFLDKKCEVIDNDKYLLACEVKLLDSKNGEISLYSNKVS